MDRHVHLNELLIGVEGLALLRGLYEGTDEEAARRLDEVRAILDSGAPATEEPISEASPRSGYRAWSEVYDEPGNPIIELEQPAVWSLLESVAPGRALDAACGTGRHAARLVALGHDVLGVDLTPEMLHRATVNVPQARFVEGDLLALPVGDGEIDLVVCALALAHLADVRPGIAELARVLRPGGDLVLSVLHPFAAFLGWHAPFTDQRGQRRFVREHPHKHSDYLAAFAAVGLQLGECREPVLSAAAVAAKRRAYGRIPEAVTEAYVGLPGVLVLSAKRV